MRPRDKLHDIDGRLFQAAMWRTYATIAGAPEGTPNRYGYTRAYVIRTLGVTRELGIRRARVNLYLAHRLKAAPFHSGVAEHLPMYLEAIADGVFAHTCHKTDTRPSVDGPHNWQGQPQHCVGLLLMLLKAPCSNNGEWMQAGLIAGLKRGLKLEALIAAARADRRCYTLPELKRFYLRGIAKRAGIKRPRRARCKRST